MSELALTLSAALLALAAGSSALAVGRCRRQAGEAEQAALFCALLGLALAAALGCSQAAAGLGVDTRALTSWLKQATLQLGVPLLTLACLAGARGWQWSRPTWGRLLLGLCACFELARQAGWSAPYALTLALASALLLAYAGLVRWPERQTALTGIAAGALLLLSAPWRGPIDAALGNLLLALALPPAALLLRLCQRSASQPAPAATG